MAGDPSIPDRASAARRRQLELDPVVYGDEFSGDLSKVFVRAQAAERSRGRDLDPAYFAADLVGRLRRKGVEADPADLAAIGSWAKNFREYQGAAREAGSLASASADEIRSDNVRRRIDSAGPIGKAAALAVGAVDSAYDAATFGFGDALRDVAAPGSSAAVEKFRGATREALPVASAGVDAAGSIAGFVSGGAALARGAGAILNAGRALPAIGEAATFIPRAAEATGLVAQGALMGAAPHLVGVSTPDGMVRPTDTTLVGDVTRGVVNNAALGLAFKAVAPVQRGIERALLGQVVRGQVSEPAKRALTLAVSGLSKMIAGASGAAVATGLPQVTTAGLSFDHIRAFSDPKRRAEAWASFLGTSLGMAAAHAVEQMDVPAANREAVLREVRAHLERSREAVASEVMADASGLDAALEGLSPDQQAAATHGTDVRSTSEPSRPSVSAALAGREGTVPGDTTPFPVVTEGPDTRPLAAQYDLDRVGVGALSPRTVDQPAAIRPSPELPGEFDAAAEAGRSRREAARKDAVVPGDQPNPRGPLDLGTDADFAEFIRRRQLGEFADATAIGEDLRLRAVAEAEQSNPYRQPTGPDALEADPLVDAVSAPTPSASTEAPVPEPVPSATSARPGAAPVKAKSVTGLDRDVAKTKSLSQHVRKMGGINAGTGGAAGEIEMLSPKGTKSSGLINRKGKGLDVEAMMQSARESGFDIPADMIPGDFAALVYDDVVGRGTVLSSEDGGVEARAALDERLRHDAENERWKDATPDERAEFFERSGIEVDEGDASFDVAAFDATPDGKATRDAEKAAATAYRDAPSEAHKDALIDATAARKSKVRGARAKAKIDAGKPVKEPVVVETKDGKTVVGEVSKTTERRVEVGGESVRKSDIASIEVLHDPAFERVQARIAANDATGLVAELKRYEADRMKRTVEAMKSPTPEKVAALNAPVRVSGRDFDALKQDGAVVEAQAEEPRYPSGKYPRVVVIEGTAFRVDTSEGPLGEEVVLRPAAPTDFSKATRKRIQIHVGGRERGLTPADAVRNFGATLHSFGLDTVAGAVGAGLRAGESVLDAAGRPLTWAWKNLVTDPVMNGMKWVLLDDGPAKEAFPVIGKVWAQASRSLRRNFTELDLPDSIKRVIPEWHGDRRVSSEFLMETAKAMEAVEAQGAEAKEAFIRAVHAGSDLDGAPEATKRIREGFLRVADDLESLDPVGFAETFAQYRGRYQPLSLPDSKPRGSGRTGAKPNVLDAREGAAASGSYKHRETFKTVDDYLAEGQRRGFTREELIDHAFLNNLATMQREMQHAAKLRLYRNVAREGLAEGYVRPIDPANRDFDGRSAPGWTLLPAKMDGARTVYGDLAGKYVANDVLSQLEISRLDASGSDNIAKDIRDVYRVLTRNAKASVTTRSLKTMLLQFPGNAMLGDANLDIPISAAFDVYADGSRAYGGEYAGKMIDVGGEPTTLDRMFFIRNFGGAPDAVSASTVGEFARGRQTATLSTETGKDTALSAAELASNPLGHVPGVRRLFEAMDKGYAYPDSHYQAGAFLHLLGRGVPAAEAIQRVRQTFSREIMPPAYRFMSAYGIGPLGNFATYNGMLARNLPRLLATAPAKGVKILAFVAAWNAAMKAMGGVSDEDHDAEVYASAPGSSAWAALRRSLAMRMPGGGLANLSNALPEQNVVSLLTPSPNTGEGPNKNVLNRAMFSLIGGSSVLLSRGIEAGTGRKVNSNAPILPDLQPQGRDPSFAERLGYFMSSAFEPKIVKDLRGVNEAVGLIGSKKPGVGGKDRSALAAIESMLGVPLMPEADPVSAAIVDLKDRLEADPNVYIRGGFYAVRPEARPFDAATAKRRIADLSALFDRQRAYRALFHLRENQPQDAYEIVGASAEKMKSLARALPGPAREEFVRLLAERGFFQRR